MALFSFARRAFSDHSQRVFKPQHALNFKSNKSVVIFDGSHCKNTIIVSRFKAVHMLGIAFASYSLI